MKRLVLFTTAALLATATAQAQNVTLTMAAAQPGGVTDVSAKNLAEIAAAEKIATIQVQVGQVLTRTLQQVAENKTDISAGPFAVHFLMSRGLGPYSGLGREKGKELASNLRMLYPYHIATFYLMAYKSTGIDSWDKLKGKTVFNGPPRGGALVMARHMLLLTTGMKEGEGYTGKQISWGQANEIFIDGSVNAAVRPGTNPDANLPILLAAGDINLVSVPKDKFEGSGWQKLVTSPGAVPIVFPVKALAHYGPSVNVISEDDTFRTGGQSAGEFVNKSMDKKLAKALTAAFIKSVPNLYRKAPFAKGQLLGEIDDGKMGFCRAGVKLHPGAIEAWEEAGFKVAACAKP
jgi:TRAP-type uncharacterized transport system substrate-binding protein